MTALTEIAQIVFRVIKHSEDVPEGKKAALAQSVTRALGNELNIRMQQAETFRSIEFMRQMIRPAMTIFLVGSMPFFAFKPEAVATLSKLPGEYWGIISIVLFFWFGERAVKGVLQAKNQTNCPEQNMEQKV